MTSPHLDGSMNNSKEATSVNQQQNDEPLRYSTPSFLSDLHLRSTEMGEIAEMPDYENLSTSAVLHYCKYKILRPYLRLLCMMGLRPTGGDENGAYTCYCVLSNFHSFQVIVFMTIGYVLQYMACFRRDRGFSYRLLPMQYETLVNATRHIPADPVCYGSVTFVYLIPSILHMLAYLYTVYLFRVKENEQLQNLMERAFLLSSNPVNRGNQRRLVHILWLFIGLSIVWMTVALLIVNVMMARGSIIFQWLEFSRYEVKITMKVLLIVCTLWHDMVQGTIITSYCLQAQLLISHLSFLRVKVLQHTLGGLEWMKEINEFRKLLKYFNDEFGPAVYIYTIINLSWAAAGCAWLLNYDRVLFIDEDIDYINVINVMLWVLISLAPFIQASRLTAACSMIQSVGHEVRTRPFVYQSTPGEDLDTILLFTSTLRMRARLFGVPILGRYLCLIVAFLGISSLILGQCHYFS